MAKLIPWHSIERIQLALQPALHRFPTHVYLTPTEDQPCYTTMEPDKLSQKTLVISGFPRTGSTSQLTLASFGLAWPFHQNNC